MAAQSTSTDVVMATTDLPAGVTSVWSPRDRILILAAHATPAEVAAAWSAATGRDASPEHPLARAG